MNHGRAHKMNALYGTDFLGAQLYASSLGAVLARNSNARMILIMPVGPHMDPMPFYVETLRTRASPPWSLEVSAFFPIDTPRQVWSIGLHVHASLGTLFQILSR